MSGKILSRSADKLSRWNYGYAEHTMKTFIMKLYEHSNSIKLLNRFQLYTKHDIVLLSLTNNLRLIDWIMKP